MDDESETPDRPGIGFGRWVALRTLFLAVTVPLMVALLLPLLLVGQEITAPSWIARRIEAQAAEALGGGRLAFGEIAVEVGTDLHPRITLTDTRLSDAAGRRIAEVPRAELLVSPRGLLLAREVLVQEVRLDGAALALSRDAGGRVALSFGTGEAAIGRAPSVPGLLAAVEGLFDRPALAALEGIEVTGLTLAYADARAGRSWTGDGGTLTLRRDGARTEMRGAISVLSGRDYATRLTLGYVRAGPEAPATVSVDAEDVAARDIATQSPGLSWLRPLDATLSAQVRAELSPDGGLGRIGAALEIGAGELRPEGAPGLAFDGASAYLTYDPEAGALRFDQIDVASDWGRFRAEGQALLRETDGGWPRALVGQLGLTGVELNPRGAYPEPLRIGAAEVELRLRLDPFAIEVARLFVADGDSRLDLSGRLSAGAGGWSLALDGGIDRITVARVMEIWPESWRPGTRGWFDRNLEAGTITGLSAHLRLAPGAPARVMLGHGFEAVRLRPMSTMPWIEGAAGRVSWDGSRFVVSLADGTAQAPQGGAVDFAGSEMVIPDTRVDRPPTEFRLRTDSPIVAALSILDRPPLRLMERTGRPVDLASGQAVAEAVVRLPIGGDVPEGALDWDVTARLSGVETAQVVPGRAIAADSLSLRTTPAELAIAGRARVDGVPVDAAWERELGPSASGSVLQGTVRLSDDALRRFGIGLPPGTVSGEGWGEMRVELSPDAPPAFRLTSDLDGIGLAVPGLGWRLSQGARGRFEISGRLGGSPRIDRLSLSAGGLEAEGSIALRPGGGLERLRLDRLALGGWLDAPVDLVGRGGAPPAIEIRGGTLDLTRATFGQGEGGGARGPMEIALDRLRVTGGIALTDFRGSFDGGSGLSGRFTARMNDGAGVTGTVAPVEGRVGVRLRSDRAGEVIRDAGLVENAVGGTLDLTLLPGPGEGVWDGEAEIRDLRIRDAPSLAQLLDAISVVGLLRQLDGQGLAFEEVSGEFRIQPGLITVARSSATGPGLGISLDGTYRPGTRMMDFQGVVSPIYFLNGIGSLLTRPGEGLIGFNFTLTGPVGDADVAVNPLSALTPGMFREIFRRPAPELAR